MENEESRQEFAIKGTMVVKDSEEEVMDLAKIVTDKGMEIKFKNQKCLHKEIKDSCIYKSYEFSEPDIGESMDEFEFWKKIQNNFIINSSLEFNCKDDRLYKVGIK